MRHGVAGNHILNRRTGHSEDLTGDPIHDASALVRVPTVYDRAHDAGLTTAAIDWPATRNAASLDFSLPFFKDQRVFESQTPRHVWAELGALGYPMDRQGEWAQLPKRFMKDAMVADVASHVLTRHAPDLLLLHFLSTDSLQHLYGPRSPEAYWAIEYVDERVGRVLSSLPAGALDRDTTVFVVSDHGFLPSTRSIRPNVRLRQLGLLRVDGHGRIERAEARVVMNHGAAYLYVLDAADPNAVARHLAPELAKLEGVSQVWTPEEYGALGVPTPDENPHAGDLLLEASPGYSFVDEADGEELLGPPKYLGTHGQLPTHADNAAFFLAAGAGIQRGLELSGMTSRDVAPTLGHLLGIRMEGSEGRVLTEILA
jgi:predicted AlkP superfamily pyrophosphatase or phosphodiesterase